MERRRRDDVPLRVVAVGDHDLCPNAQVKLRFTASPTLARAAHRNLAIVFALIVILRLFDLAHADALRNGGTLAPLWPLALGAVAYAVTRFQMRSLYRAILIVAITALASVAVAMAALAVVLVFIAPALSPLLADEFEIRASERSTAEDGRPVSGHARWRLLRGADWLRRRDVSPWFTMSAYLLVWPCLILAQRMLSPGTTGMLQPTLLMVAFLGALLVPWHQCYRRAPSFGDMERGSDDEVSLKSTAFDNATVDLSTEEAGTIIEAMHARTERGRDGWEIVLRLLGSDAAVSDEGADTRARERQVSLSRLFLRREIENTPAVATFAAASCVMPGVTFLTLCIVMQLASTMELAIAGAAWAIWSLAQLYEILRTLQFSLKLDERDESVLEVPVLAGTFERDRLNRRLPIRCKQLITMSGGLLLGVAVTVILGLLAVDGTRQGWPRDACMLFERCKGNPSEKTFDEPCSQVGAQARPLWPGHDDEQGKVIS